MSQHFAGNPLRLENEGGQDATATLRMDLFRVAALRWGVLLSTGYLLLWGTAALAVRFATGLDSARWWLGFAGLGVIGLIACVLGWRERPGIAQARALVDNNRHLGGLLMAQEVTGYEAWGGRLPSLAPLRVCWRGGQPLAALGLAAAFMVGALLVPMPEWEAAALGMDVRRTIDELEEQIELLEEENILEEPQAEVLREDMARIGEDALGVDPSRTWEALDHLADQLDKKAAESADEALRQMSDSAAAESLAGALSQGSSQLSEMQLTAAMEALSQLTQEAIGGDLSADLPPGLAEALGDASAAGFDPETLKELAKLLADRKEALGELLEALEAADFKIGKLPDYDFDYDPDALLEWLLCQGDSECDAAAICKACKKAGRGGITRGPGHTEMIWKDPSSKEDVSFDPKVLPPSRLNELDDARLLGVTRAAPDAEPGGDDSTGGVLTGVSTSGGSAQTSTILPRHRAAVQRYFQRSVNTDGDGASIAPPKSPEATPPTDSDGS